MAQQQLQLQAPQHQEVEQTSVISSNTTGTNEDVSELLTDRDLEQSADLTDATYLSVTDNQDITISEEGVYVISGDAENVMIIVETDDEAKVQIVLDGVTITNENTPAIYVKEADKVFVTTTDSDNSLSVTDTYTADGETNLDSAIFSKSDLVVNGVGTLNIISEQGNGITSKDDLKITGGTINIESKEDGLEANDSIVIYGSTISIDSDKDALHSENEDDTSLGYIYILGGTLNITAADDGIRGTSFIEIDGGTINIKSATEGIEATNITINDGTIDLYATDDGINATNKSSAYDVAIEFNGGTITLEVGSGDTDAVDSNGDLYINGGYITVTANSAFDFDGTGELNGGTVIVNGTELTELTNQQMGGGFPGNKGGFKK